MPVAPDPTTTTGGGTTTGTTKLPSTITVIIGVANALGIPPEVALAVGWQESRLNPGAAGDYVNGQPTSFGIYQLHEGGELPKTQGGDYAISAAGDPYTNAMIALPHLVAVKKAHPGYTWGQVAAAAQRPANPTGYAASVDGILNAYHQSGQTPAAYFGSKSPTGAKPLSDLYPGTNPTGVVAPTVAPQVANDWIGGLDSVLNPKFGWNPLTDTGSVIKFVAGRGGFAAIGLILLGGGLMLMFGREIFGGALLAIPGIGEAAEGVSVAGGATRAAGAATAARKAATVAA